MKRFLHTLLRSLPALAVLIALPGPAALAQAPADSAPAPYASIGTTDYAGPGRQAAFDLRGPTIRIGILAPLKGAEKADGEAIVRAARMALADASRQPFPGNIRVALAVGDESGPAWGHVADVLNGLVFNDHAVAVITSASGAIAHLSEQVGNRIGVPILTLSSDDSTTEINLPWIFRLGPSDKMQAQAMARDIYATRRLRRVLLIAAHDHDGRMGGREFLKAARQAGAPPPFALPINPLQPDAGSLLARIKTQSPQALVFWTRPENARILLRAVAQAGIRIPVYLPQETAQQSLGLNDLRNNWEGMTGLESAGIYTVAASSPETASRREFAQRYRDACGTDPSEVAAQAYDAVTLIARALREAGPNRARVRDRISSLRNFAGVSGIIRFDGQGNNLTSVHLVRLPWKSSAAEARGEARAVEK